MKTQEDKIKELWELGYVTIEDIAYILDISDEHVAVVLATEKGWLP